MKRNNIHIALVTLLILITVSACKVGKSYTRPELHLPDSLAQHQDSLSFGDMDWWSIYTDSTLRGLIAKSLEYNKDILIAAARVKEMAAQKRISTAALLPDIKGTVTGKREFENHGGDAFKLLKLRHCFPGNLICGGICAGRVRQVLPSICNRWRHNVRFA